MCVCLLSLLPSAVACKRKCNIMYFQHVRPNIFLIIFSYAFLTGCFPLRYTNTSTSINDIRFSSCARIKCSVCIWYFVCVMWNVWIICWKRWKMWMKKANMEIVCLLYRTRGDAFRNYHSWNRCFFAKEHATNANERLISCPLSYYCHNFLHEFSRMPVSTGIESYFLFGNKQHSVLECACE